MSPDGPVSGDDPNPRLDAGALVLEPLTGEHAAEMFPLLVEPALYRFLDEAPPLSPEALRRTYERRQARISPDGRQLWLNWVVRDAAAGAALGYVQATVMRDERIAWIAYVFALPAQGRGLATQATGVMVDFLVRAHVPRVLLASVEAENRPSIALLERLGFTLASTEEHERTGRTAGERLYRRSG